MPEALLVMSTKEIDRLDVIRRVLERRLSQKKAAELMGVTSRQARRMCAAFKRDGAAGLLSKRRGRPSNNSSPEGSQDCVLALVRERYADFGPTLAAEKLAELHGLRVSKETLRHWMKDAGLWLSESARYVGRVAAAKTHAWEKSQDSPRPPALMNGTLPPSLTLAELAPARRGPRRAGGAIDEVRTVSEVLRDHRPDISTLLKGGHLNLAVTKDRERELGCCQSPRLRTAPLRCGAADPQGRGASMTGA